MFNSVSLQELRKEQNVSVTNDSALHLFSMTANLHP
jgi:hypothetical protein